METNTTSPPSSLRNQDEEAVPYFLFGRSDYRNDDDEYICDNKYNNTLVSDAIEQTDDPTCYWATLLVARGGGLLLPSSPPSWRTTTSTTKTNIVRGMDILNRCNESDTNVTATKEQINQNWDSCSTLQTNIKEGYNIIDRGNDVSGWESEQVTRILEDLALVGDWNKNGIVMNDSVGDTGGEVSTKRNNSSKGSQTIDATMTEIIPSSSKNIDDLPRSIFLRPGKPKRRVCFDEMGQDQHGASPCQVRSSCVAAPPEFEDIIPSEVWYSAAEYQAMKQTWRRDKKRAQSSSPTTFFGSGGASSRSSSSSSRSPFSLLESRPHKEHQQQRRYHQDQDHVLFRVYDHCCNTKRTNNTSSNNYDEDEASIFGDENMNNNPSTLLLNRFLGEELEEYLSDVNNVGLERTSLSQSISRDVKLRRQVLIQLILTQTPPPPPPPPVNRSRRNSLVRPLTTTTTTKHQCQSPLCRPYPQLHKQTNLVNGDYDNDEDSSTTECSTSSSSSGTCETDDDNENHNGDAKNNDDDEQYNLQAELLRVACQEVSLPSVLFAQEIAKASAAVQK